MAHHENKEKLSCTPVTGEPVDTTERTTVLNPVQSFINSTVKKRIPSHSGSAYLLCNLSLFLWNCINHKLAYNLVFQTGHWRVRKGMLLMMIVYEAYVQLVEGIGVGQMTCYFKCFRLFLYYLYSMQNIHALHLLARLWSVLHFSPI